MKGIHEKIRESKKASRMKANFAQSKRHVATAPVVAHPMFSEASQTPFGLVGNEIQLKLDPDRLTGFSDLKQDELVAFLDSQAASNNQLNHAHAAGHGIVPPALGDNFLQQQGGATGDGSIKQEHSSGSPLYHDMQPSMPSAQSTAYHGNNLSQSFAAAQQHAAAARWGYGATQMTYQATQHTIDPRFLGQQMIQQQTQLYPNHSSAYQPAYPQAPGGTNDYHYQM